MTQLLEQALTEVKKLPQAEQDAIATMILDEIANEQPQPMPVAIASGRMPPPSARMEKVESDLAELKRQMAEMGTQPVQALISSLAPDPYVVLKSIPIVVQETDGDYTATFFDAGIATAGDNQEEAVQNLRSLIVDMFESLTEEEANLGPGPVMQLAVLREFIQERK